MQYIIVATPYGPIDVRSHDGHHVWCSSIEGDELLVNRIKTRFSVQLPVRWSSPPRYPVVDNGWSNTGAKPSWRIRRVERIQNEDRVTSSVSDKVEGAVIVAANQAIKDHPELLLAGSVEGHLNEMKRTQRNIDEAMQTIATANEHRRELEALLSEEQKAYIVEITLGGRKGQDVE